MSVLEILLCVILAPVAIVSFGLFCLLVVAIVGAVFNALAPKRTKLKN